MQKKLKKIALDTNIFLKGFFKKQKKNKLNVSDAIWIVSWRKEN